MTDDEWDDPKSSLGRVVESLDAVIHRHPAGGAWRDDEQSEPRPLPDNVVDLRTRLTAVKSGGGYPDDAA